MPMTSCEHLPRHIGGRFLRTWCAQWGRIGIADPFERSSTSILLGMISSVGNKGLPPQINASAYWANCWSPVPLSLESPGLSMVLTHYHGCASTVVVTIGPFKHSGGGDNPKPGVGDTRPSWWWHQGSSPITQLLLTSSGPCKQFSTRLRLRLLIFRFSTRHNKHSQCTEKWVKAWIDWEGGGCGLIVLDGGGWRWWRRWRVVDWWPHLKPGSKPGLGRLAGGGRVSPNRLRPDITFANTKLPAITLSVTKTLVCTETRTRLPPNASVSGQYKFIKSCHASCILYPWSLWSLP